MVFLNGGPAHQLNPAFSFFVRCDSQEEIDSYWDKLVDGGKPMACGWLTVRFGLCWQFVRSSKRTSGAEAPCSWRLLRHG